MGNEELNKDTQKNIDNNSEPQQTRRRKILRGAEAAAIIAAVAVTTEELGIEVADAACGCGGNCTGDCDCCRGSCGSAC